MIYEYYEDGVNIIVYPTETSKPVTVNIDSFNEFLSDNGVFGSFSYDQDYFRPDTGYDTYKVKFEINNYNDLEVKEVKKYLIKFITNN